jgi:hypothetical protein
MNLNPSDADHTRKELRDSLADIRQRVDMLIEVIDHPREPLPDDSHALWVEGIAKRALAATRLAQHLETLVYRLNAPLVVAKS